MSAEEMKIEAIKEISKLQSEDTLKEVLNYLTDLRMRNNEYVHLSQHYDTVIEKYNDVMQKLAQ